MVPENTAANAGANVTPQDGPVNNRPFYYRWHPAAPECYKVAQEFTYNLGNALTYIWRAGRKPENSAVKDLEKAVDHLRFEIERLRGLDPERNRPTARDFLLTCAFCDATVSDGQKCPYCFPAPDSGCVS